MNLNNLPSIQGLLLGIPVLRLRVACSAFATNKHHHAWGLYETPEKGVSEWCTSAACCSLILLPDMFDLYGLCVSAQVACWWARCTTDSGLLNSHVLSDSEASETTRHQRSSAFALQQVNSSRLNFWAYGGAPTAPGGGCSQTHADRNSAAAAGAARWWIGLCNGTAPVGCRRSV